MKKVLFIFAALLAGIIQAAQQERKVINFEPGDTHIHWTIYNKNQKKLRRLFDKVETKAEFSEQRMAETINSYRSSYPNAYCVYACIECDEPDKNSEKYKPVDNEESKESEKSEPAAKKGWVASLAEKFLGGKK